MRICILSRSIPVHRIGGMEKHAWTLAQGLCEYGHKIAVITTEHPAGKREENIDGIVVYYLTGSSSERYGAFRKSVAQFLLGHGGYFDLVHSQSIAAGSYLRSPHRRPVVCTMHGTFFTESTLSPVYLRRLNYLYRGLVVLKHFDMVVKQYTIFRSAIELADGLIVGSQYTKRQLSNLVPEASAKTKIIPHGIDLGTYQVMDKDWARQKIQVIARRRINQPVILVVARIEKPKGVQVAIQALGLLREILGTKFNEVTLLVVGEGTYRCDLEKMVIRMNLENNVVFLGRVSEGLLPVVYNAADLFVNPDLTEPAFGLVSVEAMACGLPVVASNAGAMPEIVDDTVGQLFPSGDARSLAKILSELLQDEEKRVRLGTQAAQKARLCFDAKRMVKETAAFYEEILSARGR
jgi:glycosyltransferase involved in cell wall biosynthesis